MAWKNDLLKDRVEVILVALGLDFELDSELSTIDASYRNTPIGNFNLKIKVCEHHLELNGVSEESIKLKHIYKVSKLLGMLNKDKDANTPALCLTNNWALKVESNIHVIDAKDKDEMNRVFDRFRNLSLRLNAFYLVYSYIEDGYSVDKAYNEIKELEEKE